MAIDSFPTELVREPVQMTVATWFAMEAPTGGTMPGTMHHGMADGAPPLVAAARNHADGRGTSRRRHLTASYVPARRAARVDPIVTLRHE